MGKALIINGANFSVNKIATITPSEQVPCTAISISPSNISANAIGHTTNIIPTLTPVNTTDLVFYSSSNTDVATVSTEGVVTTIGIGTATITATCGSKTATCSVNVSNVVLSDINYIIGQCSPNKDYSASFNTALNRFTGVGAIGDGTAADAEVVDARTDSPYYNKEINAINIPKGATKIHVHQVGAPTYGKCNVAFFDGTTMENATYPSMLKSIGTATITLATSDEEADIIEGATKLTFAMNVGGTYEINQNANQLASNLQLEISFN